MEFELASEIITLIVAAGGLILGVYNLVLAKREEQVSLVVKPVAIYDLGDGQFATNEIEIPPSIELGTVGVKVVNLSKFDVSITETGFCFIASSNAKRLCFPQALVLGTNKNLPVRIPSRESELIAFSPSDLPAHHLKLAIEAVYIHTACELEFFGKGKVIDDYKNV